MPFNDRFAPALSLVQDPDDPRYIPGGDANNTPVQARALLGAMMPQGDAPPQAAWAPGKSIDENDYADLVGSAKPSQVAGEGAGTNRIDEQDYADLMAGESTKKKTSPTRMTGEAAVPSSVESFFKDPLGVISRHPIESGAIAASLAYPALGLTRPAAGLLWSLIKTYGPPLAMGTAIGDPGIVTRPLHYLLRLSGIEHE